MTPMRPTGSTRPMRIALAYDAIYPWVAGGAERRFAEIGRRLASRHEVTLVGWHWWDGPARIERDGMRLVGLGPAPELYGDDGRRTVREAVGFARRLIGHLRRERYDVVDCSATPYLPLHAAALARRVGGGGRLVATWHEFWGEHWHDYLPDRPAVARAARAIEASARRHGDRVVTVSAFTARAMGMDGDRRAEVVPNGVDLATIAGAAPIEDGAEVIHVGRLIDEKRVDLLLDALARLRAVHGFVPRTAIIGDGPERARLEELTVALGLGAHVSFLGRVDDGALPRHLRAARISVTTSAREGYGIAVAEAQAAGAVPVVARGPFSAGPDLVRDGVDGLVVEPTADAVAAALATLLHEPARRDEMAAAATATGPARSWDRVAERMEEVYASVLAEAPVRSSGSLEWS